MLDESRLSAVLSLVRAVSAAEIGGFGARDGKVEICQKINHDGEVNRSHSLHRKRREGTAAAGGNMQGAAGGGNGGGSGGGAFTPTLHHHVHTKALGAHSPK